VPMQTHWRILNALLVFILLLQTLSVVAQEPRVTPLGTKLPKLEPKPKKEDPPEVLEDVVEVLRKTVEAHGGREILNSIHDSISVGKLTSYSMQGPKGTFDVTLVRKGTSQVQRTIKHTSGELRQGSDGKAIWESFNGMTRPVRGGPVENFIDSQTTRSLATLLDSKRKGFKVRDVGLPHGDRVLEVEVAEKGKPGRRTSYSIDKETARVTRVEWVTGEATTPFGNSVPLTEAFVLSDFRTVQGILTPFAIEREVNGIKVEETHFSTVRYNTSPKDDVFKP
jgi:hypothetical protein